MMQSSKRVHLRKSRLKLLALAIIASCFVLFPARSALAHQPHDPITLVAVSPSFAQDQTVFVATAETSVNMDLYLALKSTDNGVSWDVIPVPNTQVSAMTVSPNYADDQTLFVGTVREYLGSRMAVVFGRRKTIKPGLTWFPAMRLEGSRGTFPWRAMVQVVPE